jgi:hypothetical protein
LVINNNTSDINDNNTSSNTLALESSVGSMFSSEQSPLRLDKKILSENNTDDKKKKAVEKENDGAEKKKMI